MRLDHDPARRPAGPRGGAASARPVTLPAALRESYARDNARLDALLGLGLEELGYALAREPETAPKNIEKAGRIANRPDSLGETP